MQNIISILYKQKNNVFQYGKIIIHHIMLLFRFNHNGGDVIILPGLPKLGDGNRSVHQRSDIISFEHRIATHQFSMLTYITSSGANYITS